MKEELTPILPPELEHIIFQTALSILDQKSCADIMNLLLVAKRVYQWLRPSLFRVVKAYPIREDGQYFRPWLATLDDVGKFVQHLLIYSGDIPRTKEILSKCFNAYNTCIWRNTIWMDSCEQQDAAINLLQTHSAIRRISTEAEYLGLSALLPDAYSHLTHLDILNTQVCSWEFWLPLTTLPNLSHLAITTPIKASHAKLLLIHCPKLELLISVNELRQDVLAIRDPRFVALQGYQFKEGLSDFYASVTGALGLWNFAARIACARQYGFLLAAEDRAFPRNLEWDYELTEEGNKWFKNLEKEV
ncbi:hypothetical protein CPB83DRAFT_857104, partial [Crepidotus variabilis]